MRYLQTIITATWISVCAGCATPVYQAYNGNKQPENQTATIFGLSEGGSIIAPPTRYIQINGVDAQPTLPFWKQILNFTPPIEVEVLPGKHTLSVKCGISHYFSNHEIWIVAEPGRKYALKAELDGYKTHVWFEDMKTNQHVSGYVEH